MAFAERIRGWLPQELKIWHKLGLVCAAFSIPIGVLLYFLITEQQKPIDFAQKELSGTEYLRPCRNLFAHVLQHRLAVHRQVAGEPGAAKDVAESRLGIDSDLQALDAVDKKFGQQLSQPPERTTQKHLAAIKQKWQDVRRQGPGEQAKASDELHAQLITELRALVGLVGDASNLILDPDLDSYYSMDTILLKLPEAQDLLGQVVDYGEDVIPNQTLKPDEKTEFVVRIGLIKTLHANLNSPLSGLPVAFKDVNDSTADKRLKRTLEPALNASISATAAFTDDVEKRVINSPKVAMSRAEFQRAGMQAIDASFKLWDDTINVLDELLKKRIAGFQRSQNLTLAGVGIALAAGLALMFFIVRGFTRQINAMAEMFTQIGMGNFEARAEVMSNDEAGRIAQVLNEYLLPLVQSHSERDAIQTSIAKLLEEVSGVAEGDLTKEAEVTADMTGAIADSFNYMIEQLRKIISNVQDATLEVSGSASQIRETAEHLAGGSETQAEQIVQTTRALGDISVSIQQVSENAGVSANVAREALTNAKKGNESVQNTIEGMSRIRDQVQETAKRIKRLGESSQEIGQITQLIDDIADRTSILALNASIQAAMAGDAGRGFAVVAEEVERLAIRSTDATKKIAALVKTIQGETNEAVAAMERSIKEVVSGSSLANEAGKALGEIETVSNRLAELIQSISQAAKQQARGSEAVVRSMNEISEVTQMTAAGTKQAAQSVTQLAGLADDLRASLNTFRLPERSGYQDAPVAPSKKKQRRTGTFDKVETGAV